MTYRLRFEDPNYQKDSSFWVTWIKSARGRPLHTRFSLEEIQVYLSRAPSDIGTYKIEDEYGNFIPAIFIVD